jgi:hypothetical protein
VEFILKMKFFIRIKKLDIMSPKHQHNYSLLKKRNKLWNQPEEPLGLLSSQMNRISVGFDVLRI